MDTISGLTVLFVFYIIIGMLVSKVMMLIGSAIMASVCQLISLCRNKPTS